MEQLYNLMRPRSFKDYRGQKTNVLQWQAMLQKKAVPNVMLMEGAFGTGKTSVAGIFGLALNCENPNEDGSACLQCATCKKILSGASMGYIEIDAARHRGVDDVDAIISHAYTTSDLKKKIIILDECHELSSTAQNALLKVLENPPQNTIFILCTTEMHKLLPTVISRCTVFHFSNIDLDEVYLALKDACERFEKAYEDDALKLIARDSQGHLRNAYAKLEQFFAIDGLTVDTVSSFLGMPKEDLVFEILEGVQEGNITKAITAFRKASEGGMRLQLLVKQIMEIITDSMYLLEGSGLDSLLNTQSYKERLENFSKMIDKDRCLELTHQFSEVYSNISKSSDSEFLIETAIIKTINYQSEIIALKKRVEALEAGSAVVPIKETIVQNIHTDIEIEDDELPQAKPAEGADMVNSEVAEIATQTTNINNEVYPIDSNVVSGVDIGEEEIIFDYQMPSSEALEVSVPIAEDPLPTSFEDVSEEVLISDANKVEVQPQETVDISSLLPEGTVISGSISLEELDNKIETKTKEGEEAQGDANSVKTEDKEVIEKPQPTENIKFGFGFF